MDDDKRFMQRALEIARRAEAHGEVPVGAVVVLNQEIIAEGFNRRETWQDPTAHAELIAMRRAADEIGSWRLEECTVYVTLEPCPMCAGTLVNARVDRVVFGAEDPKAGALRSLYALAEDPRLNHRLEVRGGVMADECGEIITEFFRAIRRRRKQKRRQDSEDEESTDVV